EERAAAGRAGIPEGSAGGADRRRARRAAGPAGRATAGRATTPGAAGFASGGGWRPVGPRDAATGAAAGGRVKCDVVKRNGRPPHGLQSNRWVAVINALFELKPSQVIRLTELTQARRDLSSLRNSSFLRHRLWACQEEGTVTRLHSRVLTETSAEVWLAVDEWKTAQLRKQQRDAAEAEK